MKVLFLDVDGVLNDEKSKSRCGGCVGIDSGKMARLKQIVDETGAAIVLSSSWRLGYNKDHVDLGNFAKYLTNKFRKQGLSVYGSTPDLGRGGLLRAEEIKQWLEDNKGKNITAWAVLDDELFRGYLEGGFDRHLVKTNFRNGGLTAEKAGKVIEILNKEDKKDESTKH